MNILQTEQAQKIPESCGHLVNVDNNRCIVTTIVSFHTQDKYKEALGPRELENCAKLSVYDGVKDASFDSAQCATRQWNPSPI